MERILSLATKTETESQNSLEDRERALIAQCRQEKREAQHALYHKYKDWAFNLAYRMANNRQEAEDITQMIFVRLFTNIKKFRGDSAFSSWFYRLSVNVCLSHFRSEKKRRQHASSLSEPLNLDLAASTDHSDLRPFLEEAIQKLPEGYRLVFVLYQIQGYSHREIAAILDVTEGTSKSQLHKARKELRRLLEPLLLLNKSLQ